ncbi:MAG: hypothetical protein L0332_24395 [Chloroflexi bacterium]|nr:hypothetical protein [Chloroflexota bacterium]MCI0649923.1 hypothetical protein [Chloroflexota bacterium]MCI0729836.1 hypothetical protein [Chloroflexota bacterium]
MIVCLSVPFFAVAVERRDDGSLARKPVVTGGQPWEPRPVFGFSREVAQSGVEPGTSLRMAHVYAPAAHFMEAHPPRYCQATVELTELLADFTPRLELNELWYPPAKPQPPLPLGGRSLPAQFYLDLEGLPAKEAMPLAKEIGRAMRAQTQLEPAIGLAQHKFVAHVAASQARTGHFLVAPAGDETQFLASRSINYLPLETETHRRLQLLGIRTLGELAALPLPALQTQFGLDITHAYRLARGEADLPIQPRPPEQVEEVSFQFEEPITNLQALHQLLDHAAKTLAARLEATSLAGQQIRFQWETDGEGEREETVTLRQPTADAHRLSTALQEVVARIAFNAGVTAMTITIANLSPLVASQLSLFPTPATTGRMRQALQHVIAKHGAGCFYQVTLGDGRHPLRERRFHLHAYDPALA